MTDCLLGGGVDLGALSSDMGSGPASPRSAGSPSSHDELLGGSLEGGDMEGGSEGTCPVCAESYSLPPRVLNCLHVFCEMCLAKEQRPLSSSPTPVGRGECSIVGKGVIRCPKCNGETECHGIKSLPFDYVLINRLDAEAISKRTVVCTSCKSEDLAIARCQDCSTFLCSNCRKAHSSMLCFENHLVVSFESFDSDQASIHRAVSCLQHPREQAHLYDPKCGKSLCNECLVAGHQGHGCKKVTEFDQDERGELNSLLRDAKKKFASFDQANDNLTSLLSELQLARDSVRSSIEETFITYKEMLERAKSGALDELDKVHTEQEMKIMDSIQLCQETVVNLEHGLAFAEKLAKYGDAAEFLALKSLVTSRISKLMQACPKQSQSVELKFESNEAKFGQAVAALFGRVVPLGGTNTNNHREDSNSLNNSIASVNNSSMAAPEISNTSAARLLSSELVNAVNSQQMDFMEPMLTTGPPLTGRPLSSNLNSGGPLSDMAPPADASQLNDLQSALAQLSLVRMAGVSSVEPEPDVLGPMLDVTPRLHPEVPVPVRGLPPVTNGPIDSENHLMNNLSALVKMGSVPVGVFGGSTSPVPAMNGHGIRAPQPAVGMPPITNGMPMLENGGSRSPTSSSSSVAPPPNGNGPPAVRVASMHIRIKFGQLGQGQTQFSSPHGFCLGPNEEIVVADTNNHRIQIFDKAGEFKSEFGVQGKEEGQLWYPRKVAVMKNSGTYVICDRGNERSRMQLFTKNGEFIKKIAIRYIDIVAGLALTADGRIVAVDSVSPTVFVIADSGDLLLWFDCSEHMREPSDIAVWGGEFYICDFKGHCVVVYSECGNFLRRIGGEGLTNFPNGIDISDAGDILVGDSHGNRFHIVVFSRDGQAISEFECPYCKVSRCCGLKITSEGYVVTLAKNNHHVLILNTLYIT